MANQIVWCDIPVKDLDRAIRFYKAILGHPVTKQSFPGMTIGLLPHADDSVSGCLFVGEHSKPSTDGPLVYFNCEGRLPVALAAVEINGGKILERKQAIGDYGFRAIVLDSEGNRIALHSKT